MSGGGPGPKKTRKTNCMASLLRSNIQDFVQEVPVGQMAQGTPFRCLRWPTPSQFQGVRRGKGGGSTYQVSNTPCKVGGYMYIHRYLHLDIYIYMHIHNTYCFFYELGSISWVIVGAPFFWGPY